MKKLTFIAILLFIGMNINAQNFTIEDIGVHLSTNSTTQGEMVLIGSNLNITNPFESIDCLLEFNYLVGNGAIPSNNTLQEVLSIPSTANMTPYFAGPLAISNYTFPDEGLANVTVEARAINCTINNGPTVNAGAGLLVLAAAPIPTIGQWGIMILGILIIVFGVLKAKEATPEGALI